MPTRSGKRKTKNTSKPIDSTRLFNLPTDQATLPETQMENIFKISDPKKSAVRVITLRSRLQNHIKTLFAKQSHDQQTLQGIYSD